jgi:hypothetical protein
MENPAPGYFGRACIPHRVGVQHPGPSTARRPPLLRPWPGRGGISPPEQWQDASGSSLAPPHRFGPGAPRGRCVGGQGADTAFLQWDPRVRAEVVVDGRGGRRCNPAQSSCGDILRGSPRSLLDQSRENSPHAARSDRRVPGRVSQPLLRIYISVISLISYNTTSRLIGMILCLHDDE